MDIKTILREARDEVARFQWPDSDHDNARYSSSRRGPSGKVGGHNDDMSIVIQMLIHFAITKKVEHENIQVFIQNHRRRVINSTFEN